PVPPRSPNSPRGWHRPGARASSSAPSTRPACAACRPHRPRGRGRQRVKPNSVIDVHTHVVPERWDDCDRLTLYDVRELVHYPLETTVAIAALIFGGVLERLPRLRIGFAHGGGTLPFLLGRFDHGWTVRAHLRETAPRPPAEYVRRLYVDSLTHGAATLRLVVETMAPGAVMMGSDYPLNMGAADPVAHVRLAGLDAMVEAGVLGGNARRFLGTCAGCLRRIWTAIVPGFGPPPRRDRRNHA